MKTFLCSHLVTLRWNGRELAANLEEISPRAATINAESLVPEGSEVRVSTGSGELSGTVSRCWLDECGFEVQIELNEVWSAAVFTPDHMFPPA